MTSTGLLKGNGWLGSAHQIWGQQEELFLSKSLFTISCAHRGHEKYKGIPTRLKSLEITEIMTCGLLHKSPDTICSKLWAECFKNSIVLNSFFAGPRQHMAVPDLLEKELLRARIIKCSTFLNWLLTAATDCSSGGLIHLQVSRLGSFSAMILSIDSSSMGLLAHRT